MGYCSVFIQISTRRRADEVLCGMARTLCGHVFVSADIYFPFSLLLIYNDTLTYSNVIRYYALQAYHKVEGKYTTDIETLRQHSNDPFSMPYDADMIVILTAVGFKAKVTLFSYTAIVNQERYLNVFASYPTDLNSTATLTSDTVPDL